MKKKTIAELEATEPLFFSPKTIIPKDRSQIVSIKTGTKAIDDAIIGINKGEVTCISGLRGSGKSSWLSQVSLEATHQHRVVTLFSGELSSNRTLEWLQLQAAGKDNTTATKYANFFYVKDTIKEEINEWMDERLFIYNNNYGKKVDMLLDNIEKCVVKKHTDLLILDNLMSIDLGASSFNKNEKQTNFISEVVDFTQTKDFACILVAHPRKSMGLLRIEDISGTADLTNAVDNVFIIHRVNADFKRLSNSTFGWGKDHELYSFDNAIEVCKNRDLGVMDLWVGLYFEKESKRFLNYRNEYKHYGWEAAPTIDLNEEFVSPFDL